MRISIDSFRQMTAAFGLLALTCGIPSEARCGASGLWIGFEAGGIVESYSAAQLKKSGMPTPAQLNTFGSALGLAFDSAHNLWATSGRFQLAKYSANQLKNLANQPMPTPEVVITSSSSLNNMIGCNFDSNGNLWIIDVSAITLNEVSATQLAAGSEDIVPAIVIGLSGLQAPNFVTFDKSGNAWVDDQANGAIAEFSASQLKSTGTKTAVVTLTDDGSGTSLPNPGEIAFDKKGNLWVANASSDTVVEYSKADLTNSGSPVPKVKLSSTVLDGPFGAAFDKEGDLFIANNFSGTITAFDAKQLRVSGAPEAKVVVTSSQIGDYEITFGPSL